MRRTASVVLLFVLLVSGIGVAHGGWIVATTSDYTTGNTALYDVTTGDFLPNLLGHDDQDVVVDTDGAYVYFIERGNGAVSKYDPAALGDGNMIYQYSVGAGSNPYDIVFLESKAYVIRYGAGSILVIDQNAADESSFRLGTIDISGFDADGCPEAVHGFTWDGMVYVVLQRLKDWQAEKKGLLIKIDPETDTVVDLDPDTEGVQGVELLVKNPQHFSQADGTVYISGHVWGAQTEGVQSVELGEPSLPQSMILEEEKLAMDVTGMKVFDSGRAIFYSSSWVQDKDNNWVMVGTAFWFDPATGEKGDALPVPTPEGGAVEVGGTIYVGSRDDSAPGIYPVDPGTNTLAGEPMVTTLPPVSMVYVGKAGTTLVESTVETPESFTLGVPRPNPFNPCTTVTFELAERGFVTVDVFNAVGQKTATLARSNMNAGSHSVVWDAGDSPSGVYYIRVTHSGPARTVKATLLK